MTVTIATDVVERIRRSPGRVVLQVQGASDTEAAAVALERARPDIEQLALRGARPVERIPGGPFLAVVDREDGRGRLLAVPAVIARHLAAAGVEGTLGCIEPGGFLTTALWGFPTLGPALLCRLYPPPPELPEDPPTGVPGQWVDLAVSWLADGLAPDHALWAEVGLVEFSLAVGDLGPFLRQQAASRRSATVVAARSRPAEAAGLRPGPADIDWFSGTAGRPVRAVAVCRSPLSSHLVLGAGGPGLAGRLTTVFQEFTALARLVAGDLAYAFVDPAPSFLRFAGASHPLEPYCDEAAFDGFAFQVLGPGHLHRLGDVPPGAQPLAGGRIELSAGSPAAWVGEAADGPDPGHARREALRPVVAVLRPCLELDADLVGQERWERVKRRRLHMDDLAVPQYRFDPPPR